MRGKKHEANKGPEEKQEQHWKLKTVEGNKKVYDQCMLRMPGNYLDGTGAVKPEYQEAFKRHEAVCLDLAKKATE